MSRLEDAGKLVEDVIAYVRQATEGLITDQELCNKLELLTSGRIEREHNMPVPNELDRVRDLCDRYINMDRTVSWIDIGVAILKLPDRDKFSMARAISFALKPGDHSNV